MKATALIPISGGGHQRAFLSLVPPPVKRSPEPSERRLRTVQPRPCPAKLYLAGLHASGRRAMAARLRSVARLVGLSPDAIRWSGLRPEIVSAVRALMIERRYSPASVNATLSALKGVAHSAWQLKQLKTDEYQRIRDVKGVSGSRLPRGRALSDREVSRLVDACLRDTSPAGNRDLALIALLGSCGLRRSEAVSLDLSHFNDEAGTLRVRGKGDKERLVYLGRGSLRMLLDWLDLRGRDAGPLLCPVSKSGEIELRRLSDQAVYNALRKRAKEAHVRAFSPHDLRRTCITNMLDRGGDLSVVQDIAGHSSISTTKIYDRRGEAAKRRTSALASLPYPRRRHRREDSHE
jgi:site-specific recombinase XerD